MKCLTPKIGALQIDPKNKIEVYQKRVSLFLLKFNKLWRPFP
jgi:hypothetical protein